MPRRSFLKRSSIVLSLAVSIGCGGGGDDAALISPGGKELPVEVAVRTVRELGSSSGMSARWSMPAQLGSYMPGECPQLEFEPDGAGFSYELDFGSGCGSSALPFAVSGSLGGSIHAGAQSFEVRSFYHDFSAGLGLINGSSRGVYSLLGGANAERFGIAADVDVDQIVTAPGFSFRVQGGLEERFMLSLNTSTPSLEVVIETADLSVSLNGARQFAVNANNVIISSTSGMLPSSGSVTVIDEMSPSPSTVVVSFDAATPESGIVTVTSAGVSESFNLNGLGL